MSVWAPVLVSPNIGWGAWLVLGVHLVHPPTPGKELPSARLVSTHVHRRATAVHSPQHLPPPLSLLHPRLHPFPSFSSSSHSPSSPLPRDEGFHDHAITVLLVAWGQFTDHDITLTAEIDEVLLLLLLIIIIIIVIIIIFINIIIISSLAS